MKADTNEEKLDHNIRFLVIVVMFAVIATGVFLEIEHVLAFGNALSEWICERAPHGDSICTSSLALAS